MSDLLIIEPIDLSYDGPAPKLFGIGGSGQNLLSNDPREIWQSPAPFGNTTFTIDLGADVEWDAIAIINSNAGASATWFVSSSSQIDGGGFSNFHLANKPASLASEVDESILVAGQNTVVTSNSIVSTSPAPQFTAHALSRRSFVGDVTVSATFDASAGLFGALGLSPTPLLNPPSIFGSGYRMYWQSEQQQFLAQSWNGANDVFIGRGPIAPGNSIGSVSRIGSSIVYAVDGIAFRIINDVDPQLPLFVSARLQGQGAKFDNIAFAARASLSSNVSAFVSVQPIISRFIRVQIITIGPEPFQAGRLIVGKAFRPFYNKERGVQRMPFDSGTRTRLSDGSLSTVASALISGFKWVFGDLSKAEANTLWAIVRRRRTTEPVLVIEDADNLSVQGMHYCTLIDLQPYTRLDPRKTRWELSVEDWL